MATTIKKKAYLTIPEVAEELGCGPRNVYKLIETGKLPALKKSERNTLVPAVALAAYQRRLNGGPSLSSRRREVSTDELRNIFTKNSGGRTPEEFYAAFKRGGVEDTGENMTLLVQAVALGAGASGEKAPVKEKTKPWAIAAFVTRSRR